MANEKAPEVTLVPKLSVKTVGANGAIAVATKQKTFIMRVIGVARNIKAATGQNGDPVFGLTGQFEATNIQDGKVFASSVLYLPNGILELIMDPLEAVINGDDRVAKSQGIQFALDISAVPDANKAGYTYNADYVSDTMRADPLANLKQQLIGSPLPKPLKIEAQA